MLNITWSIPLYALALWLLPALTLANSAGTIHVIAERDGQIITDLNEAGATVIKEIDYIGLDAWSKPVTTAIRFSGEAATPTATVMVTIPDARISQTTKVASDGSWTATLPTRLLTTGNYYAYVAVGEGDAFTNSIPVAYFTVLDDESLSWQTWVFLTTSLLTIVALLSAITLQLSYNSKYHPVL